jgi:hypothetical protein
MTSEQKTVAIGAAAGVLFMTASVALLYHLWPAVAGLDDTASRLTYALKAAAFAVLPLFAAVIAVGNDRFLSEAIDPLRHRESRATQINGRVVENTVQQYVLFLIGVLSLSVNLRPDQMPIVAVAAAVFVFARIAFWIGYRIDPLYRAFGMAATLYLNLGLLGFSLWKMLF